MTELQELNFRRLIKLVPALRELSDGVVQTSYGGVLSLTVLEHHKYTTVVMLSQALPILLAPLSTMRLRVYHDARVVEVLSYQEQARFQVKYSYPNRAMLQIREKRRVNEFLGEWLDYCLIPHDFCLSS